MNRQTFLFFGLHENPFQMSPHSDYLLVNRKTQSILGELAEAIRARKSLLVLSGEVGTGKTTLMKRLIDWLGEQGIPTGFIFNPRLEPNELFEMILSSFGGSANRHLHGSPRQRLGQWLAEEHRMGRRPVLIIDEAQGLPLHVLEEVRLLLNQEVMGEKLIQIVLSGQPELVEKLRRPDLRQLRQRIELRCQTAALDREEAHGYIQKRIEIAGGASGREVFSPEAADAVYFYARGVPRVMNLLCEHSLLRAHSRKLLPISAEIVDDVARELQFDERRPVSGRECIAEIPWQISAGPRGIAGEPFGDAGPAVAAIAFLNVAAEHTIPANSAMPLADVAPLLADLSERPVVECRPKSEPRFSRLYQMTLASAGGVAMPSLGAMPFAETTAQARVEERPANPLRVAEAVKASPQARAAVLPRQSARVIKGIWKRIASSFAVVAHTVSRDVSAAVNLPQWGARFAGFTRWLRGPMPVARVKVRRTASH